MSDDLILDAARVRGIPIEDAAMFRQALTHKSATPENLRLSNERLEFLGDAVLSHVIAEYLYDTLPDHSEGSLAKARSLIVCKDALAAASTRLNIRPLLLLGATEEAMGGRSRESLIADAYEAIVAVITKTKGWEHARDFILTTLNPIIQEVLAEDDWRDPKTTLQEWCQAHGHPLPSYQIVSENGKPHDRIFKAIVVVAGKSMGCGEGKTKKTAQQEAAIQALSAIDQAAQPPQPLG
jgi:ribonuclease-3